MSSEFNNDSLLELYLYESFSLLDSLDDILLAAESSGRLTGENINEIFRIMHTIKGSSAMMSYSGISEVAHKTEGLFAEIRDSGFDTVHFNEIFDVVLTVSDFLKTEVRKVQEGQALEADVSSLTTAVLALTGKLQDKGFEEEAMPPPEAFMPVAPEGGRMLGVDPAPNELTANIAKVTANAAATSQSDARETYCLHIHFNEGSKMENIRAFMLINKLSEKGTVNRTIPESPETNPEAANTIIENGFYISYATSLFREQIETLIKGTLSVESISFVRKMPDDPNGAPAREQARPEPRPQPIAVPPPDTPDEPAADAVPDELPAASQAAPHSAQNIIGVELKKLDTLLDLVGEIVINESIVTENPDLSGLELTNFRKAARALDKLTDELQGTVMAIRMLPVSTVFQRMRRIVRDMCKSLAKEASLVLVGEATEVDKAILDAMFDPIMHLVRNAMDHAIETPQDRLRAGKAADGHVILSAQNSGGDVVISVSDDGRGLDKNAILGKARACGLLRKPESEYTDREIYNLLMAPGFSTRDDVSLYSGRGVGLDVVKSNIEKIGGSVIIESREGLGTNIIMKIPLTLAIIPCIEIAIGGDVYSIPISNIRESFKADAGQIVTDPSGAEMILLRGKAHPIVRLYERFGIKSAVTDISNGILVLVESGAHTACLLADSLVGKFQVVVKPLPLYLNKFKVKQAGVSGCTIMGNGNISLIVNVHEMIGGH
ncbi:MAG: chemotaxis protein CheA [Clostridiales bacterium]|nr:chemotaxis protein CheA [Clostridiales bacterium]